MPVRSSGTESPSPAHQPPKFSPSSIPPKSPLTNWSQMTDSEPFEANLSSDSTSSIQPTWPKLCDVDLVRADAVAVWDDVSLPLFLDLHWHSSSHHAFLKLHATTSLLNTAGGRHNKTSIYVYIYPERIQLLTLDPHPTKRMLGSDTILLRVEMIRPPALVLPKKAGDPISHFAKDIGDAFSGLARQTCFDLYCKIPRKKLSILRIRELCAAAAGAGLASLAVYANVQNLYHGKGGQIVEGDSLAMPGKEPPPQYVDSVHSELPPPHTSNKKGKKRRRTDSSSPEPATLTAIQALLDSRLSLLKQHFDDRLAMHKKEVSEMLDTVERKWINSTTGYKKIWRQGCKKRSRRSRIMSCGT